MTTSRDELRGELVAAIEAAPELPKDAREHLADVFLDRLNAEYDLVPRTTGGKPRPVNLASRGARTPRWVKVALVLAFLIVVVPLIVHHFAIVLLAAVTVFFATKRVRSRRPPTAASW